MKSINEKSNEIGWQYTKHYDPNACKQEWCEMSAREGANYVLDAIQSCIARHEDGCLALEAITLTIDELKKR